VRLLICAALGLVGCTSLTDIDVGAGDIPSLTIQGELAMPAAAARAGVKSASWTGDDGAILAVTTNNGGIQISAQQEIEFFSSDEMAELDDQYGKQLDAVDRIDMEITQLTLTDGKTGAPLDPALAAKVVLDGERLGGQGARTPLDDSIRELATAALTGKSALDLPFGIELDCAPGDVAALPETIQLQVQLQLVLVVQALKAF
jgi:hypothetical protein